MMTTPLRKFLQSLCSDFPWNYAVFWKLQLQEYALLTWEDGCYHGSPARESSMENVIDSICWHAPEKIPSSKCEPSKKERSVVECPIGSVVTAMSSLHYSLGEGIVGEVASNGKHCWIFSDNFFACGVNSMLVAECPTECLIQFDAGVKTILLVPVVPYGVLHLGSLEEVAEDLAFTAYIKEEFYAHQISENFFLPSIAYNGFLAQSSSLTSVLVEKLDKSFGVSFHEIMSKYPTYERLSIPNQMISSCMVPDVCSILGKDIPNVLNNVDEIGNNFQSSMEPKAVNQSLESNLIQDSDSKISSFSRLEEELQGFAWNDYNFKGSMDYGIRAKNICYNNDVNRESDTNKSIKWSASGEGSNAYHFPRHCELHKALGPAFLSGSDEYFKDLFLLDQRACGDSSLVSDGNFLKGKSLAWRKASQPFLNIDDQEHLLGTVISYNGGDLADKSFQRSNSAKSITTSTGKISVSSITQCQPECNAFVRQDTVSRNIEKSAFVVHDQTAHTNSHPSSSSIETIMSSLIDDEQKNKYGCLHKKKGSKLAYSKRRVKCGENQRPRPRDRQLIQDRLRELRELVPCGANCSIDGLLDRTIKHMLFMRSVADHSDKLRKCAQKEKSTENMKLNEDKGGQQNGTSWACELGSDREVYPVVVKDLQYPGHLLIEIICDDHLRFLEIAEVIQHSDLTILKGVLRSRSGNMWAHFIVEATKGFHRLDIFWPLLRLLQQS